MFIMKYLFTFASALSPSTCHFYTQLFLIKYQNNTLPNSWDKLYTIKLLYFPVYVNMLTLLGTKWRLMPTNTSLMKRNMAQVHEILPFGRSEEKYPSLDFWGCIINSIIYSPLKTSFFHNNRSNDWFTKGF